MNELEDFLPDTHYDDLPLELRKTVGPAAYARLRAIVRDGEGYTVLPPALALAYRDHLKDTAGAAAASTVRKTARIQWLSLSGWAMAACLAGLLFMRSPMMVAPDQDAETQPVARLPSVIHDTIIQFRYDTIERVRTEVVERIAAVIDTIYLPASAPLALADSKYMSPLQSRSLAQGLDWDTLTVAGLGVSGELSRSR